MLIQLIAFSRVFEPPTLTVYFIPFPSSDPSFYQLPLQKTKLTCINELINRSISVSTTWHVITKNEKQKRNGPSHYSLNSLLSTWLQIFKTRCSFLIRSCSTWHLTRHRNICFRRHHTSWPSIDKLKINCQSYTVLNDFYQVSKFEIWPNRNELCQLSKLLI